MTTVVEVTAVITALMCVVYAIVDGLHPLSARMPSFFRSRTRLPRIG